MVLIDLTGGAGFGFGALWPSANATSVSTQLPDAVDGVGGGTYPGNIIWSGDHTFNGDLDGTTAGGTFDISATALTIGATNLAGLLDLTAAVSGIAFRTATLGDANADLTVAVDEYRFPVALTADRTYTLRHTGTVPADGQRIRVFRHVSGGIGDAIFKREDATELGRILDGAVGTIEFTYHVAGNGWYASAVGGNAEMVLSVL